MSISPLSITPLVLAILSMSVSCLALAQPRNTEEPAVVTDNAGTTVVGDRESPIGLYITPWRNDAPEAALDRPARFLEEQLLPIDADVFRRQLEYYNTITDHLRAKGGNIAPSTK